MKSSLNRGEDETAASFGNRVRVGVLGCSDIALRKFIPALARCRSALLTAVAGRDPAKAAEFAKGALCQVMTADEMLRAPSVDLIYLSLPNHLHEEWSIRALESGKHVICEKPLALSAASAKRMLAVAGESGRLLYENLMFLHHPQHAKVKELIKSGKIGKIVALRSSFCFPLPKRGDFRLDPLQGGGAFNDLARYPLGTALYFLETLPSCFRGNSLWQESLNLAMHGTAVTGQGEFFSFSLAFGQQYESYYEIMGDSGKIRLERAYTTPADHLSRIEILQGNQRSEISVPAADHFQLMIEKVCSTILQGGDFHQFHKQTMELANLADEMEKGCRNDR